MAEGDDTSPKDIEREKEPRQPLIFGDFSLPPLGPDAPEGLEPLMRQYLEQAAQNENVGQQMVAWAKRQNTPAPPQEPPPRVTPADGENSPPFKRLPNISRAEIIRAPPQGRHLPFTDKGFPPPLHLVCFTPHLWTVPSTHISTPMGIPGGTLNNRRLPPTILAAKEGSLTPSVVPPVI